MRVLVTGGAGFIGSHLCDTLVEKGIEVFCLDNFATGSKDNIVQLLGNPLFNLIEHDITQKLAARLTALDSIYHLASPASPVDYMSLTVETLMTNALGTYNTLELARQTSARFLLASTSEVYGDPEQSPQTELYWGNANPVGPRSCYDEAKRFAEALTMAYRRRYGMNVVIARIFNTYGPRMRLEDGRVVPNFVKQAVVNEQLTVYGDGSQTRSFCYIDDMVEGLLRLMSASQLVGEVVNLGNPRELTVLELAKVIKEACQSSSEIYFSSLPEDDPRRRKPDISKARKLLEWEPSVSLQDGLARTIEWFKVGIRN
jgi:nucleoside-diphosphate-sugar epimerase